MRKRRILLVGIVCLFFFSLLIISCDDSSPYSRGYKVSEEQWKKAFSGNGGPSKGSDSDYISRYGFSNGTINLYTKMLVSGCVYSDSSKMYFGDGYICDSEGTICMAYSTKTNMWYYCYPFIDKLFEDISEDYRSFLSSWTDLKNWHIYNTSADWLDGDGLAVMDPCFDKVVSKGSEAALAYICEYRNCLGFDGLNVRDCYNENYFDSFEGVYKFGLVFDSVERIEDFLNTEYDLVSYSQGKMKIQVRFDENALLSSIKYDYDDVSIEMKFINYNTTEKLSTFPQFDR